jgi:predicted membrane metal-binding protein
VFAAGTPHDALFWFFEVLSLAALVVEAWALIDAFRHPTGAYPAAGKLTKPLWLIILGVATAIGLGFSLGVGGVATVVSILPVVAFVAAAVYLTDVRPKVREFRGGTNSGPYGPW